ncbi:MAG: ADP-ribosylglycohydrolase family protein [Bacteroidota bacterium]
METLIHRAQGALLGLAAGDALGTTLEFTQPGLFTPIEDMLGGGPFRLKAGQWTDDTSMALCLGHSLVHARGMDPEDQMRRYVNWRDYGYMSVTGSCFDIGGTTTTSLSAFQRSGDPFSGPTAPNKAGNGSLMRLAPVPIFFHQDAEAAIEAAATSSRTTHGARTCLDACRYYAGLIWLALHGAEKDTLLGEMATPVPGSWDTAPLAPEIEAIARGSFKEKHPPEIRGTGYVVQALEAALWAFYHAEDFESGALLAVNLGEDADTTGAIYGQVAGAYYGLAGIPPKWRHRVWWNEQITALARELVITE